MKIIWDISSKCNLSCIHCGANDYLNESNSVLTKKDYITIASNISKVANEVVLLGGEPLLTPNIHDILKIFSKNNVNISFITNGQCGAESLKDISTLQTIYVSLDGLEKTNDKIRGTGTWKKALQFINDIRCSDICINKIGVTFVLNKLNYQEVIDYIDFFDKMQIDEISINLLDISGSAKKNIYKLQLSSEEIINTLIRIATSNPKYTRLLIDTGSHSLNKYIILKTGFKNLVQPSRCDALFGSAYCDMKGFITPCRRYNNLGQDIKIPDTFPINYNCFLPFIEKLCSGTAKDKECPLVHHNDTFKTYIDSLLNEDNFPDFIINKNITPLQVQNRFFVFDPTHDKYLELSHIGYEIYQCLLNNTDTKDFLENVSCSYEDYLEFIANEIYSERIEVQLHENK